MAIFSIFLFSIISMIFTQGDTSPVCVDAECAKFCLGEYKQKGEKHWLVAKKGHVCKTTKYSEGVKVCVCNRKPRCQESQCKQHCEAEYGGDIDYICKQDECVCLPATCNFRHCKEYCLERISSDGKHPKHGYCVGNSCRCVDGCHAGYCADNCKAQYDTNTGFCKQFVDQTEERCVCMTPDDIKKDQ